MQEKYIFEDFNHFTLFLYIYMAYADGSVDRTEVKVIKEKVQKLFPEGAEVDEIFADAKRNYESFTDEEVDKIINSNFQKHRDKSFTYKYKIFSELYEIIIADGIVDARENQSLQKLKDIIEQNLTGPTV